MPFSFFKALKKLTGSKESPKIPSTKTTVKKGNESPISKSTPSSSVSTELNLKDVKLNLPDDSFEHIENKLNTKIATIRANLAALPENAQDHEITALLTQCDQSRLLTNPLAIACREIDKNSAAAQTLFKQLETLNASIQSLRNAIIEKRISATGIVTPADGSYDRSPVPSYKS